jgi:putative adenylate-forming enzyme
VQAAYVLFMAGVRTGSILAALTAYARTRWLHATLRSRAAIEAHHRRGYARIIQWARRETAFYRALPNGAAPIIDKALQQGRFADFNTAGIALEQAVAALEKGEDRVRGFRVGQSTGTSGNRGRFVISDRERFTWLGVILAKTLPDALWRRHRVALALPGMSSLYRSASEGSRISLGFFDLGRGIDNWAEDFARFAPDTLVAPPRALRRLAELGLLAGVQPFSGAEVLDPLDRRVIEQASGLRVREIYMATEGLFGVGCPHGTLHMAEDVVRCEWEKVEGSALVGFVFTDLVRRVQPMIRYRMNDLVELDPEPCPCGSSFQPVRRIEGRVDDSLLLGGKLVTPDVVRNALVDADARIDDFRIVQTGPSALSVSLPASLPRDVDTKVAQALLKALEPFEVGEPKIEVSRGVETPTDRKLRRVRRELPPK